MAVSYWPIYIPIVIYGLVLFYKVYSIFDIIIGIIRGIGFYLLINVLPEVVYCCLQDVYYSIYIYEHIEKYMFTKFYLECQ